jgi:hypothetical protein
MTETRKRYKKSTKTGRGEKRSSLFFGVLKLKKLTDTKRKRRDPN